MHILENEYPSSDISLPSQCVYVIDGNALIRSLVILPETFGELASRLFNSLPKFRFVHFVTDSYYANSIKDIERARRGESTVHVIGGSLTVVYSRVYLTSLKHLFVPCMENRHSMT